MIQCALPSRQKAASFRPREPGPPDALEPRRKEPAVMNANVTLNQVAAAAPVLAQAAAYDIDPSHSSATFKVRHLMVSNVRGELGTITGHALIDEQDLTRSTVEASIDASTINTRDEKR